MNQTQDINFLSISGMLKATPHEEGGERFIYMEASNESLDVQGEVVLAKALQESQDYYLRYGNVDLEHVTQVGLKTGIPDYHLFEIGRPVEVRIRNPRTFVKAQIYSGEGKPAEKANDFWQSLTSVVPAQRWYPSVGGAVLEKAQEVDVELGKRTFVTRVRWTNIGMSKTPVNVAVPTASTMPVGVFAKCWGAHGLDLSKALEAGYGTDMSALTGGAALRQQSLDKQIQTTLPINYLDFRGRLARAINGKKVRVNSAQSLIQWGVTQGLEEDEAADYVTRFLTEINLARQ